MELRGGARRPRDRPERLQQPGVQPGHGQFHASALGIHDSIACWD